MTAIVYTIPEACAAARVGRTSLYEAIRRGELRAVKRGRRTIIWPADVIRWLESLPDARAALKSSQPRP